MTDSVRSRLEALGRENPNADPCALVREILHRLTKESLLPILARVVEDGQRSGARAVEFEAFFRAPSTAAVVAVIERAEAGDTANAFRALFNQPPFALGDGTKATWEEATADQHEQRAAMLDAMAAGLARTSRLHKRAAEALRSEGVECLGRIGQRVAA